jgi:hypothetical protein
MPRALLLASSLFLAATPARADRREWLLSPSGSLGALNATEFGRDSWGLAMGGGVRVAYGLLNYLELGVACQFLTSPALSFASVTMENQPGTLAASLYSVDLALDLRLVGDVALTRAFSRFRPFIGGRVGGLVRILTGRELLDEQGLLLLRAADDVAVLPVLTAYAGFDVRFARAWSAGLVAAFTYSTQGYSATGSLEVSWLTY